MKLMKKEIVFLFIGFAAQEGSKTLRIEMLLSHEETVLYNLVMGL
jgi:hypothetical protein